MLAGHQEKMALNTQTRAKRCKLSPLANTEKEKAAGEPPQLEPEASKNTAHPAVDACASGELPAADSCPAAPIAHKVTRLVLLPSGPDTIHGASLPETGLLTPAAPVSTKPGSRLGRGIRPC